MIEFWLGLVVGFVNIVVLLFWLAATIFLVLDMMEKFMWRMWFGFWSGVFLFVCVQAGAWGYLS